MEENTSKSHYSPPVFPTISALFIYYAYYWLVPYWIIEFIILLCKNHLFSDGAAAIDWFSLFAFVITQTCMEYFGFQTLRLPSCGYFWGFIITGVLSIFFTAWTMSLANIVLFFEFLISLFTLIILILLLIMVIVSFIILRQPQRINLM